MLFELETNFKDCDVNALSGASIQTIQCLLMAHAKGHHLVTIPRQFCRTLLESNVLGRTETVTVKNILSDRQRYSEISRNVELKFVVYYDAALMPPDSYQLNVTLQEIETFSLYEKLKIVFEDLSDSAIYVALAEAVMQQSPLRKFRTVFAISQGGGGRTPDVFKKDILEGGPVLCFVDSDKDTYYSKLGNTARQARAAFNENRRKGVVFYLLEAREVENLIPLNCYRTIFTSASESEIITKLQRVECRDHTKEKQERFLPYFDFKGKGLTGAKVRAETDQNARDILFDVWRTISPIEIESHQDIENGTCLISRLSENCARTFERNLNDHRIVKNLRNYIDVCVLKEEIDKVAKLMIDVALADRRIRM